MSDPEAPTDEKITKDKALERVTKANSKVHQEVTAALAEARATAAELTTTWHGRKLIISGIANQAVGVEIILDEQGVETRRGITNSVKKRLDGAYTTSLEFGAHQLYNGLISAIYWNAEVVADNFWAVCVGDLENLSWVEAPQVEFQAEETPE